jgi:hypothetical protein
MHPVDDEVKDEEPDQQLRERREPGNGGSQRKSWQPGEANDGCSHPEDQCEQSEEGLAQRVSEIQSEEFATDGLLMARKHLLERDDENEEQRNDK